VLRRKLDVRSEAEWEATLEAAESELGGLDVLSNIAGYLNAAYVTDFTQRDLDLRLARLVVDHVLPERPLEATIPPGRGLLARAANTAPAFAGMLAPLLEKKGKKRQEEIKSGSRC
jgi:NAD(P)-dependent dehydrogenase (short-subunit alcohol dehydrogenase family)